jgi:hypothetical protein
MRNPMRTEAEAFSFVVVVGILAVAVALAGWLANAWVALAVFLVLGTVLGLRYFRSEPKVVEPAVWERGHDNRHRILVVANETVGGAALRGKVVERATAATADVLVVCPALNSQLRHWTSDEDDARAAAQERLDASLAALASAGVQAEGQIGDDDPVQAIEDALRTFPADEIVLSTHPPGRSNWLERDIVEHVRERFALPITHVVVDLEAERTAVVARPADA